MSGEFYEAYCQGLEAALKELIDASRPLLNSLVVDETTDTLPLMDRLEKAIKAGEKALDA